MSPRARITLAFLVLVALVLDFLFYTGFFASDDLQYLTGSRRISSLLSLHVPGAGRPGIGNSRLGVTVPSGIVYWISGGSVAAVAWFHVLYHLALVGLAFALGRLFHGEVAGLVAAGIAATSPILYPFAGAILPDNATAVWLAVILILLELVRRREAADGPLPARTALRWYSAIGVLFGVAYACKDTALIMTVPAAACVMASAPSLKSPIWIRNGAFMIAGLLAFLVVELLALRLVMAQWVFRPSMVENIGDVFLQRMELQGTDPFARLWYAVGDRLSSLAPVSTWILLAGAVGYAFVRGRRLSLLLFFWWPFLYMTVGTTSFTAYRPSSIQPRYYAVIIIPAAVMTAIAAHALWRRWSASTRTPAWLRGRLALGALLVAAAGLVAHELDGNLPLSGNLYKAPVVRGLAAAYESARENYPQYPILVGSRYGDRMKKLLGDRGDERLYWPDGPAPPDPPYLLIGLGGDRAVHDPALVVESIAAIRPARSRFDLVASELDHLFGLPPHHGPTPHPSIVGTIDLVTHAADRGPPGRTVIGPWIASGGAARLRPLPAGIIVEWDKRIQLTLQHLERGTYSAAPVDPRASLTAPARRVRITVPVRLLAGKTQIALHGFAYDVAGQLAARQTASAPLVAWASPTALAVDFELPGSANPIASVRIRLRMDVNRPGFLFVAHPAIDAGGSAPAAPPP